MVINGNFCYAEVILLRDQLAETRRQYSERLAEIQVPS